MVTEPASDGFAAVTAALRAGGCVFAEDEAVLLLAAARDRAGLDALVARRVAGEPLELVVGWAEFAGLRIAVRPGVFVPRRRTEYLASIAARLLADGDVVVDLCCGAGAVGAALYAASGGRIALHAADLDPVAVACARENLAEAVANGNAAVYEGDLDAPLPAALEGRVAVLAANVPYVPTGDIALLPSEAREFEPSLALDGGSDGLEVLRRVAKTAPRWLRPGGRLLVEMSDRQREAAVAAFREAGLECRVHESDEYEVTVLVGESRRAGGRRGGGARD